MDGVGLSPLVLFLKDTLPSNTLETVLLDAYIKRGSGVSMDTLYKILLRRHQSSLKRIRIGVRKYRGGVKNLLFKRKMLSFITGGKMSQLRELSMGMSGKKKKKKASRSSYYLSPTRTNGVEYAGFLPTTTSESPCPLHPQLLPD